MNTLERYMPQTDIVLISWHRPKMTELTIRTIRRNTFPQNHRLVVIDNGSPDDMQTMLSNLQHNGYIDELILNKHNIGLEPARNQGLDRVRSDWFVCTDNDCLPQPIEDNPCPKCRTDWLDKLYNLQRLNPEFVSIACRTQVMIGTGNIFEGHEDEGLVKFPHPGGSLRLMETKVVRKVGGWSEEKGRGSEERYIGAKILELGLGSAFATKVRCLHLFGPQTTDRWGYDKDWKPEDTGHSDIWHPALTQGDDIQEIVKYAGKDNAIQYYS